ncbi:MAG: orotate phosphoribosyltransferase [bacterium]
MTQSEKKLIEILAHSAYHYSSTPEFKLASGKMSHFYIDCKSVIMSPEGLILCGQVVLERIEGLPITAIGGLEFGAIPITLAATVLAYQKGILIKPFVVRKESKDRGLKKLIEGRIEEGESVVIVEDVVTSGKSALIAAQRIQERGAHIKKVIALVDREEGGKDALYSMGIDLEAIFTIDDLHTHRAS